MKMATGGVVRKALIGACVIGSMGMAYAQSGSTRAGDAGLSATSPGGNMNGGGAAGAGTAGSILAPTPGLATPGGVAGSGRTGATAAGSTRTPNNMRANGTSLNQNPDPRVPSLGGRPPARR
ncbi:hypothetical protein [Paraburkholderia dilworthii]|uniref:hypothetical protein n=1 Tax=Paraburkholderia dilworthii TaxID=948106 RepID=UPI00040B74C4|nr:hypothetical protein [Paraburkholderia dilworthii]